MIVLMWSRRELDWRVCSEDRETILASMEIDAVMPKMEQHGLEAVGTGVVRRW